MSENLQVLVWFGKKILKQTKPMCLNDKPYLHYKHRRNCWFNAEHLKPEPYMPSWSMWPFSCLFPTMIREMVHLKIPAPSLALNEPSSEKKQKGWTASKAELSPLMGYLWSRISLPWPRTGRKFTLPPFLRGYHHHAMPADQLLRSGTDRDPSQTTAAQNRAPPLVPTVSAVSEHSTQLGPSV